MDDTFYVPFEPGIGAGIVNELPDPATGKNHEAWACPVPGHVVTAARRDEGTVVWPAGAPPR